MQQQFLLSSSLRCGLVKYNSCKTFFKKETPSTCHDKIQFALRTNTYDFYYSQSGPSVKKHPLFPAYHSTKEGTSNTKLKCPQCKLSTLPVPYPVNIKKEFLFLNFLIRSEHWSTQFNFQIADIAFLQTSLSVVLGKKPKTNQTKNKSQSSKEYTQMQLLSTSRGHFQICSVENLQLLKHAF